MNGVAGTAPHYSGFLATAPATRREKQVAFAIAVAAALVFVGLVPFVRVPLPPWPGFIPSYETALFFIDLITASLLFDQFARVRSLGILVLGCAYLFDAFMILPHALSFPGAFTATGLLGCEGANHGLALRLLAWRLPALRPRLCRAEPPRGKTTALGPAAERVVDCDCRGRGRAAGFCPHSARHLGTRSAADRHAGETRCWSAKASAPPYGS